MLEMREQEKIEQEMKGQEMIEQEMMEQEVKVNDVGTLCFSLFSSSKKLMISMFFCSFLLWVCHPPEVSILNVFFAALLIGGSLGFHLDPLFLNT